MNRSPCPPPPRSASASYDIPSPGGGVLKAFLGNWSTDSIIYARSASPANVVTGLDPSPLAFWQAPLAERDRIWCRACRSILTSLEPPAESHQRGSLQHTRCGARRLGTQCTAGIRRHSARFDAAKAVQIHRARFSSGAGGSLQHLQPPQFR
jgi:hypothetical protein